MKVVYDISVLGDGHYYGNRTGIFRTVERVAEGLASSGECDLTFSSIDSVRVFHFCLDYLKTNPALQDIPLENALASKLSVRWVGDPIASLDRRRPHNLPTKALRRVLALMLQAIESRMQQNDRSFPQAGIFHSPWFPLPPRTTGLLQPQRFLTVHDLIPVLFPQWFEPRNIRQMDRTYNSVTADDWVVCNSQSTKNDLCEHFPIDPARVFLTRFAAAPELFYPVTDPARIAAVRSKYGIPDAPYVMSLNTLEPRKNMDHAIRAFTRLVRQERDRDLRFVLVGGKGWHYSKVFEAIEEAGPVRDQIILTGYVADEDLAPLYSGALAFVYPSLYEGFGLPPLEAMQCGIPVITSNTSSLPEVVGDAGIMLDPTDADGLSQAMLDLYRTPSLREVMRQRSLERVRQFSWERCIQETLAAYRVALVD